MFRIRKDDKFLIAITNMSKENLPRRASSRSWMIETGIRRYWRIPNHSCCPQCKQPINRIYRKHIFLLPASFGRGVWLSTDCSCVVARQKEIRDRFNQVTIQSELSLPMPKALREHSFANFKVESFNRQAYMGATQFTKNFAKNTDGKGIIFCGKSGRGKTHLACAILNQVGKQYTTAFAHIPTLLERVRQGEGNLQQLLSVDLLVLDDLGSERGSDWTLEKLLIIVDGRLNRLKPTVYTTNYNLNELEMRVGSRLASRILYNSLDLVVQGPDWREIKYRQAGI